MPKIPKTPITRKIPRKELELQVIRYQLCGFLMKIKPYVQNSPQDVKKTFADFATTLEKFEGILDEEKKIQQKKQLKKDKEPMELEEELEEELDELVQDELETPTTKLVSQLKESILTPRNPKAMEVTVPENHEEKRLNADEILTEIFYFEQHIKQFKQNIMRNTFLIGMRLSWLSYIDPNNSERTNLELATNYKYDYAKFLIRIYDLLSVYKKLQYSILPLRFFKNNYVKIKEICDNDKQFWTESVV